MARPPAATARNDAPKCQRELAARQTAELSQKLCHEAAYLHLDMPPDGVEVAAGDPQVDGNEKDADQHQLQAEGECRGMIDRPAPNFVEIVGVSKDPFDRNELHAIHSQRLLLIVGKSAETQQNQQVMIEIALAADPFDTAIAISAETWRVGFADRYALIGNARQSSFPLVFRNLELEEVGIPFGISHMQHRTAFALRGILRAVPLARRWRGGRGRRFDP